MQVFTFIVIPLTVDLPKAVRQAVDEEVDVSLEPIEQEQITIVHKGIVRIRVGITPLADQKLLTVFCHEKVGTPAFEGKV